MKKTYLTGIKPTGNLHLGNYFGVIKPIINLLENEENIDVFFFIADYHALTVHPDPKKLKKDIHEMMASLSAIFKTINIKKTNNLWLYRQSKIPQIFEYKWILSCYTAKGLLNRNHAYKSIVDNNIEKNKDPDKGIFSGLFEYPVLQAADIYIINPDYVPIGKDQKQHLEITNKIGRKINYFYKVNYFKEINPIIQNNIVLPGTDENKMSKSYGNTINLLCDIEELKDYVYGMKTNIKGKSESKFPSESAISQIYKVISDDDDYNRFIIKMQNGNISWKELKDIVYCKLKKEILDYHVQYEYMKNNNEVVNKVFHIFEKDVRNISNIRLNKFKKIIGL